jgi:hypothetical protein
MRDESDHGGFSQISLGRMRGMVETDQTGVPNLQVICTGESRIQALTHSLSSLPTLMVGNLAGGDLDGLAGPGIATLASLAPRCVEGAEAGDGHASAGIQFHGDDPLSGSGVEDRLDGVRGLSLV